MMIYRDPVKVSKAEVIKAIQTEDLRGGHWAVDTVEGCKVCAVGAVIRQATGLSARYIQSRCTFSIAGATSKPEEVMGLISSGNYLGALSSRFEHLWDQSFFMDDDKRKIWIIEEMTYFVNEYLPDEITLPIAFYKEERRNYENQ